MTVGGLVAMCDVEGQRTRGKPTDHHSVTQSRAERAAMCDRHNLGLQFGSDLLFILGAAAATTVSGGRSRLLRQSTITCLLRNCFSHSVTGVSAIISYLSPPLMFAHIFQKVSTVTQALLHHLHLVRLLQSYIRHKCSVVSSVNPPGVPQGRVMKSLCKSNELLIKRNNSYTKRWTMFFLIDIRIFVVCID